MLSDLEIEALEEILFAEPWADEALDFFGLHGVVCASVVGPVRLEAGEIFRLATGQEESAAGQPPGPFSMLVFKLQSALAKTLDLGNPLELPEPEDGDPMNALENWCAGFVDTFLEYEPHWTETASDEEIGELLLPMMALSGLFEDEDFQKVRESDKLANQMADAIPDTLTDLYLLFHSPA